MKVAIMQPYFFPYIGYFQLIHSVDLFILYDNIKYTKKGWINRNRLLRDHSDFQISLPLTKQSDFCEIRDRSIAPSFNRIKFLNQIKEAYRKAPYFKPAYSMVSDIIENDEQNLFKFLHSSICKVSDELNLDTKILISSEIDIDHNLKGQDKIFSICKAVQATEYVNAIGGQELYSKEDFSRMGIDLSFVLSKPISYAQFSNTFIPWLSIIDVLMFNACCHIKDDILLKYELI
ncbi:WbqC family protein [Kiloniella majae]|uniref:WbqC family protein n=1 Tax=Kiloniella majae TaxID=1938558 RepID=UPI000A276FD6|nr:WbqC family protein [Kiloniella majae]